MQPTARDVAHSVVCVYVCLCVGHMGELYKMTEPIKMSFGSKQPGTGWETRSPHRKGEAFCQITLDNAPTHTASALLAC